MVWQNKLFYFAFVQNWRVSSVTPVESYFCHFKLHHSKLCARKKLLLPNKSSSGLVWTHTYGGSMPGVLLSCSVFLCGMLVMVGKKDRFYVLSGLFFPLAVVAAEGQKRTGLLEASETESVNTVSWEKRLLIPGNWFPGLSGKYILEFLLFSKN